MLPSNTNTETFSLDSPRIRFNWGFHDATFDAERGTPRDMAGHFDPNYANGYRAGIKDFEATGTRGSSSEAAWWIQSEIEVRALVIAAQLAARCDGPDCGGDLGPDDCCLKCDVMHGAPCDRCGGRGYHRAGCADV